MVDTVELYKERRRTTLAMADAQKIEEAGLTMTACGSNPLTFRDTDYRKVSIFFNGPGRKQGFHLAFERIDLAGLKTQDVCNTLGEQGVRFSRRKDKARFLRSGYGVTRRLPLDTALRAYRSITGMQADIQQQAMDSRRRFSLY